MSPMLKFLGREMSIGGLLGAACWGAIVVASAGSMELGPILLGTWGFSALFAIGYMATSLESVAQSSNDMDM